MCGIAGVFHFDASPAGDREIQPMLDLMPHRGPDGEGQLARGPLAIGMRRLAIIDVAGGQQPIFNEDRSMAIVCNGEIYNYPALRAGLEKNGHRFQTHSDVEVILHLYEDLGPACFSRLNGMFAAAIADFRAEKLILARDPFGQKPLYLWQTPDRLWFASELKCLAGLPGFSRRISNQALANFLRFRYIPAPLAIFEGVRKLHPGSHAVVEAAGKVAETRYFQLDLSPQAVNQVDDSSGALTRERFTESVSRHLMSERPLGVFLSGGLDSSAVVACMHRLGHKQVHTYTVGFEGYLDNEFATAHQVATHFQTDHHEVLLGPDDFLETLERVVYSTDEPLADLTTVPLYHLAKGAAEELVVVLSGEGSDELLAGYPGFEDRARRFEQMQRLRPAAPLARAAARLPLGGIARRLRAASETPSQYLARTRANMTEIFSDEDLRRDFLPSVQGFDPGGELARYYAQRPDWDGIHLSLGALTEWWLPDDLLQKADRITMAHSLELRCPFLDVEFARHCAALTISSKVRSGGDEPIRKIALKNAFRSLLPEGIALQKKKGFAIPVYSWLADRFASYATREMEREDGLGTSLVTRQARARMLAQAKAGDLPSQHRVWSLIVLNRWGARWQ